MPRPPRRAVVMAHLHEAGRSDVIAPGVEIKEAGIAIVAQPLLVVSPRIGGERHTVRPQRFEQFQQNPRQFLAGHMEQRRVCKNAVKAILGQLHRQKILMEDLALRMRARHGDEMPRSIEPHGFVPQGSEVTEIPAGSTTEIKNGKGRLALYRIKECRIILADIVVSRAIPESPGEPIVIRDRRVREPLELIRVIPSGGPAHRRSTFPIFAESRSAPIGFVPLRCACLRSGMTPGFRTRHSFRTAAPCHNSPRCSSFATGSRSQSADTHAFVQHLGAGCQAGFRHPISASCTLIYPGKRPRRSPANSPTLPGPRGVSVSWSEFEADGGRAAPSAWDGTREANRALNDALPLLEESKTVTGRAAAITTSSG